MPGSARQRWRKTALVLRRTGVAVLLGLSGAAPCAWAAGMSEGDKAAHLEAVMQARDGRFDGALQTLEALYRGTRDRGVLYDIVRVAGWAGDDGKVIRYGRSLDRDRAPLDVLEVQARALRNAGELEAAAALFEAILAREPGRRDAVLGWAPVTVDLGRPEAALRRILPLLRRYPDDIETLMTAAYVWKNLDNYVRAAGLYHRVVTLAPAHAGAREGLLKAVREMGAPHLAYELAQRERGAVDRTIVEQIINDRIAVQIRWGELPALSAADRYRDTDIALRLLDEAHPGGWQMLDLDDAHIRRLAFDRMVALRDRRRMGEVVDIYEQLLAAGLQPPGYVLMAAADAYLYLEQPEMAGDVYRRVLAAEPDHHNAAVALFFALTDGEAYPAALAHSATLARRYQPWRRDAQGTIVGPDRRKLEVDVLDAKAQAFADDLADAQARLEGMLALAPGNDDIRLVLANVYRWRGWPRRALRQLEIVRHAQPESVDALLGLGETRMDLRRYRPVAAGVAELQAAHPRHKAVRKLARRWEVHNKRQFYTRWRWAESDGPQIGASDMRLDTYLYSSPVDYDYRFFAHHHYARADLNTGEPENHRFGAGVEYTFRDLRLIGELSGGAADNDDAGFGLSGDWRIDDYWTVGAAYESNTTDVPLRAIGADIDSERYALSATYRWHESQRATLAYNFYSFDDGNARRAVSGSLQRRLWNRPAYKLDATLWLYASDNSRQNAPYFNPDSDASASVTFSNDWRVWRRYERSFHHNLALTLGGYWQAGFDGGFTWSLSYQHRWRLSDTLALSYGVARSRRVFDGTPEFENAFFGDLDVRF